MSTEEIKPTQPQLLAEEIRKKFHGVNDELGATKAAPAFAFAGIMQNSVLAKAKCLANPRER